MIRQISHLTDDNVVMEGTHFHNNMTGNILHMENMLTHPDVGGAGDGSIGNTASVPSRPPDTEARDSIGLLRERCLCQLTQLQ